MAKRQNSPPDHDHTLQNLQDLLITFDHKVVRLTHTDFEADLMHRGGGVRLNTTRAKGQK